MSDLEKLKPGVYLNDCLIDFKIFHILLNLPPEKRDATHSLGSRFYYSLQLARKEPDKYKKLVRNSLKSVNIFTKDFILMPLNVIDSMHWSLCIIVRPLLFIFHHFICNEDKIKYLSNCEGNQHRGCILHMNSYPGTHSSTLISEDVKQILCDFWILLQGRKDFSASVNTYYHSRGLTVDDDTVDIFGLINKKLNTCVDDKRSFDSYPFIVCKVPCQSNGYDCGIYTLKFVECIMAIELSTREEDIARDLIDQVHADMFVHEESVQYRIDLLNTLTCMAPEYAVWKQSHPSYANEDEVEIIETADSNEGIRNTRSSPDRLQKKVN